MIEIKNVSKSFKSAKSDVHAVNDVSLTIGNGEIFGIIGFSGAGKSTLVRCINLLERPTSGSVWIDGQDITKMSAQELRATRKKIGMIFQHFNLMPSRTIFDNIAYALKGSGKSKEQIKQKVRELLKTVEMADKENAYPSQLSGGQKQRVAIARALANEPKILLCDEATSALDPQTTKQILKLLKKLNLSLGITIVVITHEMAVVKELCDHVAVMDHGKVIEEGETFSVFVSPREALTKTLINTTSNLKKIHEWLDENSSAIALHPGELIAKLSYTKYSVSEPLISTISQKFGIVLNVIFADIDFVQGAPIGGTVGIFSGEHKKITQAIEYLIDKNVDVEVIKDERVS